MTFMPETDEQRQLRRIDDASYFRLCYFSRPGLPADCSHEMACWIDERGAVVGYKVQLDTGPGARSWQWWRVDSVGSYRATREEVAGRQIEARAWREESSLGAK